MGGLGGFCVGGFVLDKVPVLAGWLFPCWNKGKHDFIFITEQLYYWQIFFLSVRIWSENSQTAVKQQVFSYARQTPVNTNSLNTSLMLFSLLTTDIRKVSNWQVHAQMSSIIFSLKGSHICIHCHLDVNNLNQTLTLTVQYSQHGPEFLNMPLLFD